MHAKSAAIFLTSALYAQTALAAPSRRFLRDINLTNDVLFFDSPAFQDPKTGAIQANIQALVTQRAFSVTGALLGAFELLLKTAGVDVDDVQTLKERISPFGQIGIDGKFIDFQLEGCSRPVEVGKTAGFPDLGLLQSTVDIGEACGGGALLSAGGGNGLVANIDMGDKRVNQARIFPSGPTGFGVISDIDDTIKDSKVLDKPELLKNTFLRDAKIVSGMPELYSNLKESLGNPPFFYVSGSPFQLYNFLHPFINENYPAGPLLMKNLTVSPTSIGNFLSSDATKDFKLSMIKRLNGFYPKKNFLVVGDSTEKDPETYGEAFRVHGAEFIKCIWIRQVDGAKNDKARFDAALQGVPADKFRLFTDPSELAGIDVAGGEC